MLWPMTANENNFYFLFTVLFTIDYSRNQLKSLIKPHCCKLSVEICSSSYFIGNCQKSCGADVGLWRYGVESSPIWCVGVWDKDSRIMEGYCHRNSQSIKLALVSVFVTVDMLLNSSFEMCLCPTGAEHKIVLLHYGSLKQEDYAGWRVWAVGTRLEFWSVSHW